MMLWTTRISTIWTNAAFNLLLDMHLQAYIMSVHMHLKQSRWFSEMLLCWTFYNLHDVEDYSCSLSLLEQYVKPITVMDPCWGMEAWDSLESRLFTHFCRTCLLWLHKITGWFFSNSVVFLDVTLLIFIWKMIEWTQYPSLSSITISVLTDHSLNPNIATTNMSVYNNKNNILSSKTNALLANT